MGFVEDFLMEQEFNRFMENDIVTKHARPKKPETKTCCIHLNKAGTTCPTCWLSFCDDCMIVHNKIARTHVPVDVSPPSIYPTLPDCFPFNRPGTAVHPNDVWT